MSTHTTRNTPSPLRGRRPALLPAVVATLLALGGSAYAHDPGATAADGTAPAVSYAPTVVVPEAIAALTGCEAGTAQDCYEMGNRYHGGDGVSRDNVRSVAMVRRACELGLAPACYDLGVRHLIGEYAVVDANLAIAHILEACDGDYAVACYFAGTLLRDGVGIERARDASTSLLRRSCELGYWDACAEIEAGIEARPDGEESRLDSSASAEARGFARMCDAGFMMGCLRLSELSSDTADTTRLRSRACEWGLIEACDP